MAEGSVGKGFLRAKNGHANLTKSQGSLHFKRGQASEVLLPLGGEPADDVGAEALFSEHFPNGIALASGGGDGNHLARDGVDLGKARNLVVIGHLASGNGGPEHGRELGLEGGEIAVNFSIHKTADTVHASFGEEVVDDLPVSGVPPDEEDP